MRTLRLRAPRALLVLGTALALFAPARAVPPPSAPKFTQTSSDLKADPAARFGTLKNGLRYVILPNAEPKNRVSLRLLVVAGALQENDDQRGLAHFLEHLSFNGSKHFPPGTLVKFFQRMGMNFGGDTNASTSFDSTVYMLELPDTKRATLDEGFTVFADYAGGLLLEQASVEKERGIILSEKRARDSVEYRSFIAEFDFLLGNTRLPSRLPIGETSVIEQAGRDRFVDYYNAWYRPERMAVIAVGDFDPAIIEKQITEKLSPLAARAPARPDPDMGAVKNIQGLHTLYHYEAEAPATTVSIQTISPKPNERDNAATRLAELRRDIAISIINRRLSILAKKENSTFTDGGADVSDSFNFYRNASISLTCKPGQWSAALATAEQELRRAIQYGFTGAELREATATLLNHLEQAVRTAPTRRSEHLAQQILVSLLYDKVFTTPADNLALYKPALARLTPETCLAALREAWTATGYCITVIGNAKIDGSKADAQKTITEIFKKSATVPVTPPEKVADASFAYADFGPAGTVKNRKHINDLNLDLVTFANDVRLNLKKTDFEAGKVQISVRIGTGELTLPADKPGLAPLANATFTAGGLGKHSADELQRIFAGRTMRTQFQVRDDALTFAASTNRNDLLLQLQLITAYITDPGYRPEAMRQAQKYLEQVYNSINHTPQGPLQVEIPRYLANGDNRFGFPTQAEIAPHTLADVRGWLAPQFATGPVEIAIIGDIDADATLDAVARTLGTLPPRSAKPALEAKRRVSFPAPAAKIYRVDTEIPKGILACFWPTTDGRDVRISRRLALLAEIFADRLRVQVREKLGDTYSPAAASDCSDTFRDYGVMFAYVVIDPGKAQMLEQTILAIADDLAKKGVTEDELARAKQPILTGLRESARTNGYWLAAVLSSAQEFPQRLDWCRTRYSDNEAITKADLDALAKKYLPATRAFRFTILPAPKK